MPRSPGHQTPTAVLHIVQGCSTACAASHSWPVRRPARAARDRHLLEWCAAGCCGAGPASAASCGLSVASTRCVSALKLSGGGAGAGPAPLGSASCAGGQTMHTCNASQGSSGLWGLLGFSVQQEVRQAGGAKALCQGWPVATGVLSPAQHIQVLVGTLGRCGRALWRQHRRLEHPGNPIHICWILKLLMSMCAQRQTAQRQASTLHAVDDHGLPMHLNRQDPRLKCQAVQWRGDTYLALAVHAVGDRGLQPAACRGQHGCLWRGAVCRRAAPERLEGGRTGGRRVRETCLVCQHCHLFHVKASGSSQPWVQGQQAARTMISNPDSHPAARISAHVAQASPLSGPGQTGSTQM